MQLLEQSPIPMDEVIFGDLVADLNTKANALGLRCFGIRVVSGTNGVTYTDASPHGRGGIRQAR